MSDDKVGWLSVVAMFLGLVSALAYGCEVQERGKAESQAVRGASPTVTTCVEHSVLDRVQVVQ